MDDAAIFHLALAGLLLLGGQAARALRWALLLPPAYARERFHLLMGLSLGNAANILLPWRLGELLRSAYVWTRTGIRLPFIVATVVAERLSDALALGVILTAWSRIEPATIPLAPLGLTLLGAAAVGFTAAAAIKRSEAARRLVWWVGSLFNDQLRNALLDLASSLDEVVAGPGLRSATYISMTFVMWALYFGSFRQFSDASGLEESWILCTLFSNPFTALEWRASGGGAALPIFGLAAFTMTPVLLVIVYGGLRQRLAIVKAVTRLAYRIPIAATSTRDRFNSEAVYHAWLASHFSGDQTGTYRFAALAARSGVVHRFFPGGSGAVVAMMETEGQFIIRKFAAGAGAEKLNHQASWLLARNQEQTLPTATVLRRYSEGDCYWFDMAAEIGATDLYEALHTAPASWSRAMMSEIFDGVSRLHASGEAGHASDSVIADYLDSKVCANARSILQIARSLMPEAYTINGAPYALDEWRILEDKDWLFSQINIRRSARIHGDLTIENIIVSPSRPNGWYLIDPNPGNIFNSPLIDWAKLMQSFHLGYENLNRTPQASIAEAGVVVVFARSAIYAEMHMRLELAIRTRFGEDGLREAYFHEIVNYLRLIPYKFKESPARGLVFFACASMLLREYKERLALRPALKEAI